MQLVDPRVSTDYMFLTRTNFSAILLAVRASATVIVIIRPSGTQATIIPMQKTTVEIGGSFMLRQMMRKHKPTPIAKAEISLMKFCTSIASVASEESADVARFAIRPIIVLSPVLNTIPIPAPAVQRVPKKQALGVSKTFTTFFSADLKRSSDSPVSEALLTFISFVDKRMQSAGMLSPPMSFIMSPGTRTLASIAAHLPSRKHRAVFGIKFLKSAISDAAFDC